MGTVLQKTSKALRDYLRSEFVVGDRIPNEQALVKRFSVSRATLREAIGQLAAEGLLEKQWGVGTFVVESGTLGNLGLLALRPGIVASLRAVAESVSMPFSDMRHDEPDAKVFSHFPCSATVSVKRVYAIDGKAAIYADDVMVTQVQGRTIDFGDGDWMKLLVPDLFAQIGVSLTKVQLRVAGRRCTAIEAERLDLDVGEPVLATDGKAFDGQGRVLVRLRTTVRTDLIRPTLSSDLHPGPDRHRRSVSNS